MFICRDYNINLIRQDMHEGTGNFVNNLYGNSLVSWITRPTRLGKTSTLIDNILANKCNYNAVTRLLITDISDHLPIFFISKSNSKTNTLKFITSTSRPITESDIQALRADLINADWSFLTIILISTMLMVYF